jgi:hypothetical protein
VRALARRIVVGAEPLTEGIGFSPDAFREGFVFHAILARRLKFSPQALDGRQTLVVDSGIRRSHAREGCKTCHQKQSGMLLHQQKR